MMCIQRIYQLVVGGELALQVYEEKCTHDIFCKQEHDFLLTDNRQHYSENSQKGWEPKAKKQNRGKYPGKTKTAISYGNS